MSKDYYKTLEIGKNASDDEIKKSYRKLALKFHPDRAPAEKKKEYEQKFKEVSEAYGVLSDKTKRSQYDQFGQTFDQGGFGGQRGFSQQDFSSFADAFGGQDAFEDLGLGKIFSQMFGFGSRDRKPATASGQDLVFELEISLEEAYRGFKKEVEARKAVVCSKCRGKGGENLKTCPKCQGRGYEQVKNSGFLGIFIQERACSECRGRGEVPGKVCSECRGEGRIREKTKIRITIPAGIGDGQTLKLDGQGEAGLFGGPAGDLYVNIAVQPHRELKRQGNDLLYNLLVSFPQAALGDKIRINALDGQIDLKIPAGIQPGETIRLKGKGMPHLYGRGTGDLLVRVQVEVPKKLTREQKKLVEELSRV